MAKFQKPLQRHLGLFVYIAGLTFLTGLLLASFATSSSWSSDSFVSLTTTMPKTELIELEPLPQRSTESAEVLPSAQTKSDQDLILMLTVNNVPAGYEKQNVDGWQTVRMKVTGYCPCSRCCGTEDGITACNHHIKKGDAFVAADKFYRFGTEMVIPGYNGEKSVKVLDRGKAIKGSKLDIFFHSHQQAREWGVKYLDVLVKAG